MKRTTISLLVAALFVTGSDALAQVSGSASVTLIGSRVGSVNPFRFEEYRDLSDGAQVGADLKGGDSSYFWNLFGENLGRDDQLIELKGGKYGSYRYSLTNSNIIHNLTFNAITPFSGTGTNFLTFPGALGATPATNTALWNRFDYSVKHESLGGDVEWSRASPYYFRTTANQKETKGIKPLGVGGTSPGGATFELPMPISFTTTDLSAEAGYASKLSRYSVNVSWSKFEDRNDFLTWRNPAIIGLTSTITDERNTIASDNNMWKVGANALWRQLPVASTLALRGTYSNLTSSIPVQTTYASVTGAGIGNTRLASPSATTFDGDIVNKTLSASLTSQPARALDSRLYWNWTKKENRSTQIVFTPSGPGSGGACDFNPLTGAPLTTCTNELFEYRKNNLGVDLQYRVTRENKLSGGWDYADTHRERHDFHRTKDHKAYVEWKNGSWESVTARIKYQHLWRRSEFGFGDINPGASAINFFNFHLKRFDAADNDQDLIKLALDATPRKFLDLGAEINFKRNDYRKLQLGRTADTRQELYLSGAWGDPGRLRISAFWDYERSQYDSSHWQGTPNAATFPAAFGAGFLWRSEVKDKNYITGLGAEWKLSGRLKLKGSLIWQETDGTVEFSENHPTSFLTNIPNYDSFKREALDLRAIYALSKSFEVQLGVAHEDYKLDDVQMNGYNYTQVTGVNQNFLSGAYAFSSYHANIVYLTVKYLLP
jgi:MtrB/PioB family decaheme-associated outer membrane protein